MIKFTSNKIKHMCKQVDLKKNITNMMSTIEDSLVMLLQKE